MIKLFFLSVKCQGLQYRCILGTISIGVGCKEGGAAWGAVCRETQERGVATAMGDVSRAAICFCYFISLCL